VAHTGSAALTSEQRELVAQAALELGPGHVPPSAGASGVRAAGLGHYLLVGSHHSGGPGLKSSPPIHRQGRPPTGPLTLDGRSLASTTRTLVRATLRLPEPAVSAPGTENQETP
jgi:hypothetical protein